MRLSYRSRLFFNFLLLFVLFGVAITIFQLRHERTLRRLALRERLANYTALVNKFLTQEGEESERRLISLLPDSLRLTIMNPQGEVLFDSHETEPLENHLSRVEIQQALLYGNGDARRYSETLGCQQFYYAERFPTRYVRVALPYTKHTKNLLSADFFFLYFMLALFAIGLLALLYLSGRMGRGITRLREFAHRVSRGEKYEAIEMPDNELGEVGRDIIRAYQMLEEGNARIRVEQEKLMQHFMHTAEGIALFDAEKQPVYSNTHFLRYINILRDEPTIQLNDLLSFQEFEGVREFIDSTDLTTNRHTVPSREIRLRKGRLHFLARVLLFPDRSFEISLVDVTQQEENRKLKQEMTSNIAHELRTPVSSIQGYVETLLRNGDLEPEQRQRFLAKAFTQCERLSDLIKDITLIATFDESDRGKEFTRVNLHDQFDEITQELSREIEVNGLEVENGLPADLVILGNEKQLFSLWRNLLENAIRYAGQGSKIYVGQSAKDDRYAYLVFWDNGIGVAESHLERLFERFYRVDEGRTRIAGGSGLGLSIVKNTVIAHGGQITAKQHKPQGLEFVFTLQVDNS